MTCELLSSGMTWVVFHCTVALKVCNALKNNKEVIKVLLMYQLYMAESISVVINYLHNCLSYEFNSLICDIHNTMSCDVIDLGRFGYSII